MGEVRGISKIITGDNFDGNGGWRWRGEIRWVLKPITGDNFEDGTMLIWRWE